MKSASPVDGGRGDGACMVEHREPTVEVFAIGLRDMKWALVVSQHRSMRQAAESLNVRQSTLSRRLRNLEALLCAQLFERTNGGTRPTVAGREFLTRVHHILTETETAWRKLRTSSRGESGRLTVGVHASFSTGNMYATLAEHHQQSPKVDVSTVDGSHDQLLCALANNAVDVAIMTGRRAGWDDRVLPLWSERVIVALHAQHPLSRKEAVFWPDLAGESILIPLRGPGPELERLLVTKLGDYGAQRLTYHESGLDRLLSLVATEHGILLMLEGATGIHCDQVVYREIQDGDGSTRLNFTAYWRQSNANPTLAPFLKLLRQRYPDLSGGRPAD